MTIDLAITFNLFSYFPLFFPHRKLFIFFTLEDEKQYVFIQCRNEKQYICFHWIQKSTSIRWIFEGHMSNGKSNSHKTMLFHFHRHPHHHLVHHFNHALSIWLNANILFFWAALHWVCSLCLFWGKCDEDEPKCLSDRLCWLLFSLVFLFIVWECLDCCCQHDLCL